MLELKTKLPVVVEEMLEEMRYFMYSQNAAPMEEMKRLYTEEVALRKKLHNELVDLRGNIRVYCRVRPLLEIEKADGTIGDGGTARFPIGKEKIAIRQGGRDEKVRPGLYQICYTICVDLSDDSDISRANQNACFGTGFLAIFYDFSVV
jgi:hypothetical protein